MTRLVRASLQIPGVVAPRNMPATDNACMPRRGQNQPMSLKDINDPSHQEGFTVLRKDWPIGNGHGPALGPEKRADARATMSRGMASLYDEDAWKRHGTLTRRAEVWSPGLPAWQGRSPNLFGFSPGDIGASIAKYMGRLSFPSWVRPGAPMAAAGATLGGALGAGAAGLYNVFNPGSADAGRAGLLGALLGTGWGYSRKS